jgi:hypothetical protein
MKIISLTFSVLLIALSLLLVALWGSKKVDPTPASSPTNGTMVQGTDLQPAAKAEVIPVTGEIK